MEVTTHAHFPLNAANQSSPPFAPNTHLRAAVHLFAAPPPAGLRGIETPVVGPGGALILVDGGNWVGMRDDWGCGFRRPRVRAQGPGSRAQGPGFMLLGEVRYLIVMCPGRLNLLLILPYFGIAIARPQFE